MARLIEFTTNHFLLVSAFCAVLVALLWTLARGIGSNALTPQQGVLLLNRDRAVPLDIRKAAKFRTGHIINAINIELAELAGSIAKINKYKDQPVLVYCDAGASSAQAVKQLRRAGFTKVYQLQGGVNAWRGENLPLEGAA